MKQVIIKPAIVIEIAYEEIQKSPTYSSGYALRFPRFVRLRPDKSPQSISTKKETEEIYNKQRGRNEKPNHPKGQGINKNARNA